MKVKELIEHLSDFPDDFDVVCVQEDSPLVYNTDGIEFQSCHPLAAHAAILFIDRRSDEG